MGRRPRHLSTADSYKKGWLRPLLFESVDLISQLLSSFTFLSTLRRRQSPPKSAIMRLNLVSLSLLAVTVVAQESTGSSGDNKYSDLIDKM